MFYLEKHPGDAGEWGAHLQQKRHHGEEVTHRVPHHSPHIPRQSEEVVCGQGQVQGSERHIGAVQRHILKQEEARGRQDVKPGPVLLAGHLVRRQGAVLGECPKASYRALDPKHSPCSCQVPEHLLLSQQEAVCLEAGGRDDVEKEEYHTVKHETRTNQGIARTPGGILHCEHAGWRKAIFFRCHFSCVTPFLHQEDLQISSRWPVK